jgi:hypothetical protein
MKIMVSVCVCWEVLYFHGKPPVPVPVGSLYIIVGQFSIFMKNLWFQF